MTIEKKSLISSMQNTKKATVASEPTAGSTAPVAVKAGTAFRMVKKAGVMHRLNKRLAKK